MIAITSPQLARSRRRWKSLAGLLAIGLFAVLGGFLLPLKRSELRLREALAASHQLTNEKTAALEAELKVANERGADLARQLEVQGAATLEVQKRIEALASTLTERFRRLDSNGLLAITSAGDRVSVAVSNKLLFPGSRTVIPKHGRVVLCQLSKVLLSEFSDQIRVTGYFGKSKIDRRRLRSRYRSTWELSAARAAAAARVLEQGCGAPTDRFVVVAYGPRAAGPIGENVAFELIVQPES